MPPISNLLADLRRQFLDQLPAQLEAIRTRYQRLVPSALQADEAEGLHCLLLGLAGPAGTLGLPSLSAAARQAETRLAAVLKAVAAPADAEWQAIGADLDRLDRSAGMLLDSHAPTLKPPAAAPRRDRAPLVHLVEDDPLQAEHLSLALRDDGYRVRVFTNPAEFRAACTEAEGAPPDAVVMDMILAERAAGGAGLLAEIKDSGVGCPPVVFVSLRDDLEARLAALRAGACRYLIKPVNPGRLIDVLDALTGRQPLQPYRVLMVEADPLLLETHAAVLRAVGMEVLTLSQPLRILDVLNGFNPDVVVLDVHMPEATGPELAAVLRERDAYLRLPVLFLSAEADINEQLLALNLSGDDVLQKPVQSDHLVSAVNARARRARQNATIRQQLETTLYEREREHLALNHHAIVSIADAAGNLTYVNDKFCEISGYARGELIGQSHILLDSDEQPAEFYQDVWHTLASGRVWKGEVCNRRKDGSRYWAETTIMPFLNSDGIPYQYVSIRTDISALKENELSLRLQSRAMESSVNGILIADARAADMPLIYVNPAFERISGYSAEEVLGRNCRFLHTDDRAQPGLEEIRAALHERRAGSALLRNYRKSGELFWNHLTVAPVRNAAGDVTHFIGVSNDVTERKRAEQAAEAHKERLRRGQLFANIGTWDWNVQTGELYWTERIAPLFGYPVGELETAYDNFLNAIHPDDRQAVIDAVTACIERDVPYEIEHRVVWPDGTVRWLLERGAVARDADGKPLQMLGVVQDIDDRKRAELALAERERELREAQTLAHIGNWTADLVSGRLSWSDEIYRIFGHAPGSLEPSVEAFHAAVHPDDLAQVHESEKRAEQTGRHDVVHRIVRPDGTVRHVHELAQMETDAAGNQVRMTGTVQDVTERVEVEQALMALSEEAERANRAKSDFLSSMSHELRTPMNAVLGFGQLMEYDDTLPEAHQDSVQEILRAGRHLLELINEVLDLAKVESGHIDLSLEPVEVCPIVEECLSLVASLADKREIQLSHKGLRGAAVRADRTRLKQVLLNLLSNAIKYNRDAGSVRIEVKLEGADRLRIRVTDTGPGIPPARRAELFQPFNRLAAGNSEIEGTGIGLTITRRIVELMGGIVDVKSEVGVGSTFWIELPLESAPADGHAHAGAAGDGGTSDPHIGAAQHTVLYIEDNPANIKLVAQILGRRPHIQLFTAHTPELGIELALARRPDLILLDINLPGMDGYQVLEVFKADARLQAIPVVAITANAMTRDIERGKAAGFADYLTKPLDVRHFHQVVDACLETAGKA
jgi:PAS domain S-box-containing protein